MLYEHDGHVMLVHRSCTCYMYKHSHGHIHHHGHHFSFVFTLKYQYAATVVSDPTNPTTMKMLDRGKPEEGEPVGFMRASEGSLEPSTSNGFRCLEEEEEEEEEEVVNLSLEEEEEEAAIVGTDCLPLPLPLPLSSDLSFLASLKALAQVLFSRRISSFFFFSARASRSWVMGGGV